MNYKYFQINKTCKSHNGRHWGNVHINSELTDPFKILWGLKQGDGLAPKLFNLALQYVIGQLDVRK